MAVKLLLVSPYPPQRDGVANYAGQVATKARGDGHNVTVISPQPSAAGAHVDLRSLRGLLVVTRRARRADQVQVQFQPEIFFHHLRLDQFVWHWLGLMILFRFGGHVEVVVHETGTTGGGRAAAIRARLWRLLWHQPSALLVHTATERSDLLTHYQLPEERVRLVEHGASFQRRTALSRQEARAALGVPADAYQYLSIGFLQPHKGFDRGAVALAGITGDNLRLDIVGDIRVYTPDHDAYAQLLAGLAEADPRVHLHQGYVSDEDFDEWIVAADAVVLPYREIWSSSVVERAALYERPVIVTSVGGLRDQVRDKSLVVDDADGLRAAMARLAGASLSPAAAPTDGPTRAQTMAANVRAR
ncbi:MAG: glycosyltransferase family 4 protein, partial [Actinomycetota bacterium]|nr:glycosyltransferase family 4 protein [Actinomycetota bacterium]